MCRNGFHDVHRDGATSPRNVVRSPDFTVQCNQVDAIQGFAVVAINRLRQKVGVVVAQVKLDLMEQQVLQVMAETV